MAKHKNRYNFLGNHIIEILYILFIIVILIIAFAPGIMKVMNTQTYVVHVTDKDRMSDKNKYLVYSFDLKGESRVFEISDSLFKFRFDSSDDYNQIEVGKTYKFTTGGYRVPIFSWYPNIYEYEEVPTIEDKSGGN
ncbi:MAG: hypothetical protein J5725_04435 [Bacteroidales bacterium]|nr:hypothetical protein [Bacteroidales bacterium]